MLHVNKIRRADPAPAEAGSPIAELIEFVLGILRQQLFIIIPIALVVASLGVVYVLVTPKTYTAHAIMIIDRGKAQVQLGGVLNEVPLDTIGVDGQIQVIKSETVAEAVVKKLNLTADPEFIGPPRGLRGLLSKLRSAWAAPQEESDLRRLAMGRALESLKLSRDGYVVQIDFASLKPQRAAQVANAFADCYIEDQQNFKDRSTRAAGAWLRDRIEELRDKSLRADEAVVKFKEKNNIISTDGKLVNDQELSQLNSQLVLAREKTAETRARLDRIEAVINAKGPDKDAGAVSDTLNNPIIVKLRTQYLDLVNREADWARQHGEDHLAVVHLRRQIGEIRKSIEDELRHIAETYKSEYEIAKQRQGDLEKSVNEAVAQAQETSQALTELRQLESSAETYRTLYKNTLQRNMELVQQQSFPGSDARLITRASTPTGPSAPKTLVILCASAIGGVMLGFGAGVLRALMDRTFRTSAQVEEILEARCLALAPTVKQPPPEGTAGARRGPRTIVRDTTISWEVIDQPLSRFAEAMRSIKPALELGGVEKAIRVLGFTSTLPKEGKSTIAAGFALLMAHSGARTLLVDCDLRNPALSALLAPGAENGLLEVMSGKSRLEDVVWTDAATNLAFLPAIMRSRSSESSAVLSSPALRVFFDKLRQQYDCVIVDLSPVAPIIDVQLTAGLVDAYIYVVEWAQTKIDVVGLALNKATVVQDNLLGVVLNKVDFKALGKYEGHLRDYYADQYYAQYGQV
jgi:succinoglycan biosynthesis transport protein ExoP